MPSSIDLLISLHKVGATTDSADFKILTGIRSHPVAFLIAIEASYNFGNFHPGYMSKSKTVGTFYVTLYRLNTGMIRDVFMGLVVSNVRGHIHKIRVHFFCYNFWL